MHVVHSVTFGNGVRRLRNPMTENPIARTVLVVAAMLCCAELAARVDDWIRFDVPFTHTPDEVTDLRVRDSLGFHGRPHGRYHQWRLNNFGFRGRDITPLPAAGCTRVLALGASETMGYYETAGKEYPAQLADSLQKFGCYEVLNGGIPGMSLKTIVAFWNAYARRFAPQVVLIYPSPTFYLGNEVSGWPPVTATVATIGPPPAVPPRPRLIDRLHQTLHTPDVIQRKRLERWIRLETAGKPDSWYFHNPPADRLAIFLRDLDSLVTDIRAAGAVPVVMSHATRTSFPGRAEDGLLLLGWHRYAPRASADVMLRFERIVSDSVRVFAARKRIPLVDIDSALTGHYQLFGDVVHFTDEGAARVAGTIARTIGGASLDPDNGMSASADRIRQ
jgi:hypothetical protein